MGQLQDSDKSALPISRPAKKLMRCVFKFDDSVATNYFNLLCKYYPGAKISVTTDDTHEIIGEISLDFFNNELTRGTNYEICILFRKDLAFIQCLPKYTKDKNYRILKDNFNIQTIADIIDSNINSMLYFGPCRTPIYSYFPPMANFDDIRIAFLLIKNTDHITRFYIHCLSEFLLLALDDQYLVLIDKDKICYGKAPIFDVSRGFNPDNLEYTNDLWNKSFREWLVKFKETNGDNWNDQII